MRTHFRIILSAPVKNRARNIFFRDHITQTQLPLLHSYINAHIMFSCASLVLTEAATLMSHYTTAVMLWFSTGKKTKKNADQINVSHLHSRNVFVCSLARSIAYYIPNLHDFYQNKLKWIWCNKVHLMMQMMIPMLTLVYPTEALESLWILSILVFCISMT